MKNQELAKIFFEIAGYLETENIPFKPVAYQRAAAFLNSLEDDIGEVYKNGGTKALEDLPAIGKSIALKIEEYLKTGKIQFYEDLIRKISKRLEKVISGEKNKALNLISYGDVRGDLHCHSNWDGGRNSLDQIAEAAKNLGYEYVGISDHTKFLKIEHGLDENQLKERNKEIDGINSRFKILNLKFRLLKGCEANILDNGSIDINDDSLVKLDYVIAGLHSNLKMEKGKITERMIKAMKNPNIDIISHPTGRLIRERSESKIDFGKILKAAKEFKTILEINANPRRLDLKGTYIKLAKKAGVKMIISSDAHENGQLKFIGLGVAEARKGLAQKSDIINTEPLGKLLKYFNKI